jgi:serine/threonine protein kinase
MAPIPSTIGRYQIVELVGRGGMGVLYRARDPVLERDVALKMMHMDFTLDTTARERFQREAKAVARLQHRNVVTIHELGEFEGAPYIVMEFLSGKDLDEWFKSETASLTLLQKIDIAIQLCKGLAYAHEQGIVHRDIKPGNVRILEDGTVKILDFGIAKFAMSSVTQSGTVMGTPSYMAPEQVMGLPLDGRADLFAAGVLLYELFSGAKPFGGDSATAVVYQIMHVEPTPIRELAPDLPEGLEEIVSRALQKNADDRYAKATEMAADLQTVKMMLDLPLTPGTGTLSVTGPGPTLQLHATSRPRTGASETKMLDAKIRPSAAAASADAAPRARAADLSASSSSNMIYIVGAAVVVALLTAGYFLLSGGGGNADPATQTAKTSDSTTGTGAATGGGTGAATTAEIRITSEPAGAKISVNGTDTGQVTPAAIPAPALPATVELALTGYRPGGGRLTEADLKSGAKSYRLAREAVAVRLTVSGPFPFELVQGAKTVSAAATQHQITVQPNSGTVIARNPELFLNSPLSFDSDRPQASVTIPAPGTLAVFATMETCSVILDGQDIGFPPIPRKPVAAGAHTVAIKCPEGKGDSSQRVTVASGAQARVTFSPPQG